jgi:hypothetical protein
MKKLDLVLQLIEQCLERGDLLRVVTVMVIWEVVVYWKLQRKHHQKF